MPYKDPSLPENIEKARASRRKHYHANKQPYLDRAKAQRDRLRQMVRDLKDSTPCTDCGIQYRYYVMQFDHVNGNDKIDIIQKIASNGSERKLLEEIEKCEVVCANCHAIRTWNRMNNLL